MRAKKNTFINIILVSLTLLAYNNCGGPIGEVPESVEGVSLSLPSPTPVPGQPTPTPTPFVTPTPAPPTPTPPPTTGLERDWEYAEIVDGQLPRVESNFDRDKFLTDSGPDQRSPYGHPDVVGAFRFHCRVSHMAFDDPIVHPDKPGDSHLHVFFGNTKTDANSTYKSLRENGEGTCEGGPLNRSAYWMPALLINDGDGNMMNDKVFLPDAVTIYYKDRPENASLISRGLRYVFGFNMANPANSTGHSWVCDGLSGTYDNIEDMVAAGCNGDVIRARLSSPTCTDGRLDSPDHRSHVVKKENGKCPASHPITLPAFTFAAKFNLEGLSNKADILNKIYLASDHMNPGIKRGSTLHADWMGAWDDDVMAQWVTHAIGDFRNVSGGGFGNGRGMVDPFSKFDYDIYATSTRVFSAIEVDKRIVVQPMGKK